MDFFKGLLSGRGMNFPVSGIHVKFLWSLTDFLLRLYNFSTFIPCALKNIRSLGQSIRKIKVLAVEKMMLHLKQTPGFYLIHSFAGGIGQNGMTHMTPERVG
jgi:hypothetical protein